LSAEKIFCGESAGFLVVFWGLLLVLYGALGVVWRGFVVRFNIVCGAIQCWLWCALAMLTVLCGKEKSQMKKEMIA
jgi:hypothetical protein